jgi:hypothetical protein
MTDHAFEARLARELVALADDEIMPFDVRLIAERAVATRGARGRGLRIPPGRRRWLLTLVAAALLLVILLASTLILGSRPMIVPAPQGFPELVMEQTGPMARARSNHAAVALPGGDVLVTGGWDGWNHATDDPDCLGCGMNETVESYDPVSGSFARMSSPVVSREHHTATALADGRVLLAGGRDPAGNLLGAVLYDPDAGLLTEAGRMRMPRDHHVAVALPDGRILVLGGVIDASGSPTTGLPETYNPVADLWTGGPPSDRLADAASATVLANGNVLVLARVATVFEDPADSRGFALHVVPSMMTYDRPARLGATVEDALFGSVRGSSLRRDGWVLFTLRDERNQGVWPGDDSGLYAIEPASGIVERVADGIGRPTHGPIPIADGRVIVLTDEAAECGPVTAWVIGPSSGEATSLGEVPEIGTCNGIPGAAMTPVAPDGLLITGGNRSGGTTTEAATRIRPSDLVR